MHNIKIQNIININKKRFNFNTEYKNNYIIIASHINYQEARNILIDSLKDKWPLSNIIIVLNGSDIESIITDSITGLRTINIKSNIFEYSSFFVPKLINANDNCVFLLLHDTCKAMNNSEKAILNAFKIFKENKDNILWCSNKGQFNICIFDRKTSDIAYEKWKYWETLDKKYGVEMEWGNNNDSIKTNNNLKQFYVNHEAKMIKLVKPYSTKNDRILTYLSFLELEKYFMPVDNNRLNGIHPNIP